MKSLNIILVGLSRAEGEMLKNEILKLEVLPIVLPFEREHVKTDIATLISQMVIRRVELPELPYDMDMGNQTVHRDKYHKRKQGRVNSKGFGDRHRYIQKTTRGCT